MTLMTLRRPQADGNTDGEESRSAPRRALLTLREAVILLIGLVAGVATGILTYFGIHNLPEAILAGVPACAGALKFLDTLIA
jgi:hypothetical protein